MVQTHISILKKCRNCRIGMSHCTISSPDPHTSPIPRTYTITNRPPPSGDMYSIVPAHRHGHQNGHQVWCFFAYDLVVRRGNMVRILARWWRPVASSEALDPLHQAMQSALHRCTSVAIKIGRIGGAFIRCRQFCNRPNRSILT